MSMTPRERHALHSGAIALHHISARLRRAADYPSEALPYGASGRADLQRLIGYGESTSRAMFEALDESSRQEGIRT